MRLLAWLAGIEIRVPTHTHVYMIQDSSSHRKENFRKCDRSLCAASAHCACAWKNRTKKNDFFKFSSSFFAIDRSRSWLSFIPILGMCVVVALVGWWSVCEHRAVVPLKSDGFSHSFSLCAPAFNPWCGCRKTKRHREEEEREKKTATNK